MTKYSNLQEIFQENPFTLALSSGFFGFYAHLGFVKALEHKKLRPQAFSGASAGAIVAAAMASGWTAVEFEKVLLHLKVKDFFDPAPGRGLLRGRLMERSLAQHLKADFKKLERPLRVSTFKIMKMETVSFAEGDLPRIVRASCSIPFAFHPVRVGPHYFWDGGTLDKMAVKDVDPKAPLLSHCILERGPQRPFISPNLGLLRRQIALPGVPTCGPHKLHRGKEIIDYVHAHTIKALEKKFEVVKESTKTGFNPGSQVKKKAQHLASEME